MEGEISFIPTYKYDIDSDVYDTSKKRRVPSYTDRILYKQPPEPDLITLQQYDTIQEIRISDHRPVFLNLWAKIVIPTPSSISGEEGENVLQIPVLETGMSSSQVCVIS